MRRLMMVAAGVALLGLSACDRTPPAGGEAAAPEKAAATAASAPAPVPAADPELEQLKTVTPVDACVLLTPDKLKTVYPDQTFEVHQKVDPQMSGYVWDSRCTYWAGVGTIDFAKDAPTHTVEIFVATAANEAKARSNLASRAETATTTSGYQPQAVLGANAYNVTDTGMARLFFVKGQSEVQINVSDLDSPNAEKVKKALALAQTL